MGKNDITMNQIKAYSANQAIYAFLKATKSQDLDSALTDLLCDLMHWADFYDQNFNQALALAKSHYKEECFDNEQGLPKDFMSRIPYFIP